MAAMRHGNLWKNLLALKSSRMHMRTRSEERQAVFDVEPELKSSDFWYFLPPYTFCPRVVISSGTIHAAFTFSGDRLP
jgi:hypothetical protein